MTGRGLILFQLCVPFKNEGKDKHHQALRSFRGHWKSYLSWGLNRLNFSPLLLSFAVLSVRREHHNLA